MPYSEGPKIGHNILEVQPYQGPALGDSHCPGAAATTLLTTFLCSCTLAWTGGWEGHCVSLKDHTHPMTGRHPTLLIIYSRNGNPKLKPPTAVLRTAGRRPLSSCVRWAGNLQPLPHSSSPWPRPGAHTRTPLLSAGTSGWEAGMRDSTHPFIAALVAEHPNKSGN